LQQKITVAPVVLLNTRK